MCLSGKNTLVVLNNRVKLLIVGVKIAKFETSARLSISETILETASIIAIVIDLKVVFFNTVAVNVAQVFS